MFWAVLVLALFVVILGIVIYRIDKKVKSKYETNFNPHEWDLPSHIELPASIAIQKNPQMQSQQVQPQQNLLALDVKVTFERKASVYSEAQVAFYKALQAALAGEFTLLTNIDAVDVLAVVANNNPLATQVAVNKVTTKRFDFVVCDKTQLTALCVIDLNSAIDAQLKAACESAQLVLVSFNSQASYDAQLLRTKILMVIGFTNALKGTRNESGLEIVDEQSINNLQDNGIDLVLCPECSAVMLKRKAKNGVNAGKLFWLCSIYPKCRGMRAIK